MGIHLPLAIFVDGAYSMYKNESDDSPFLFLVLCWLDNSRCFITFASLYFNTRSSGTHSSQLMEKIKLTSI